MVNDTISDFLTKIRNANNAKHHLVEVPLTKITKDITQILKDEGFIENYLILNKGDKITLIISLKYFGKERKPVLKTLERVSKPGIRFYSSRKKIPNVLSYLGVTIMSTSQGIITDRQAKSLNIGGEILCTIS